MALTGAQYTELKRVLRVQLSDSISGTLSASELLSFVNQLYADTQTATLSPLSVKLSALLTSITRSTLCGAALAPQLTDSDLALLFSQLLTEAHGSAALPVARYSRVKQLFRAHHCDNGFVPPNLSDGEFLVYAGTLFPSLPLSFWASGGYWDLGRQTGAQDAPLGSITSLVGSLIAVPSAVVAPKLQLNAVGGNNAARVLFDTGTNANLQYFSCNALSALFRGSPAGWTVFMHTRMDKSGEVPLWSCLRSDGNSSEQLFGRMISEALALRKVTGAGGTTTQTAVRHTDPYSDSMACWVFNGATLTIYTLAAGQTSIVTDALGAVDLTALSASVDRFTFGASVSSIPFEAFSGYLGKFAVSSQVATAQQVASLFAGVTAGNYINTQALSPNVDICGASRTLCSQDVITGAGWRDVISRFIYDNGLSFYTTAQGIAGGGVGVPRSGTSGNGFTSANSNTNTADIQAQSLLDIANTPGPVRLWLSILSDGDNNAALSTATCLANAKACYLALLAAGVARDPAFRLVAFNLPPLKSPDLDPANAGAIAINAGLAANGGTWDQVDALYPNNKLFRVDANSAAGGVWSVALYGADTAHLNRLGCLRLACDPTYGMLWASDGTQTLGSWLRAMSPTPARPAALTTAISGLSAGFSIAHGTPVTITVTSSRIGFKARVTAGSNSGLAAPTEIYDGFLASSSYAKTPNPQATFTFTPSLGDVGPMTISVLTTDVDGVTTATASISGTVT